MEDKRTCCLIPDKILKTFNYTSTDNFINQSFVRNMESATSPIAYFDENILLDGLDNNAMTQSSQQPTTDIENNKDNSFDNLKDADISQMLERWGLNENDIQNLCSKELESPGHCPGSLPSHMTREPLTITVESDEESMHSWRPNWNSLLSSDFFFTPRNLPTVLEDQIRDNENELRLEELGPLPSQDVLKWTSDVDPNGLCRFSPREQQINSKSHLESQRAQLNGMKYEMMNARRTASEMKETVDLLTEKLREKRFFQNNHDIKQLSAMNAELRLECQCLCMEVDYYLKGKAPLGEVNEEFYKKDNDHSIKPGTLDNPLLSSEEETKESDSEANDEANRWECPKCTFANHPAIGSCEMCHRPRVKKEPSVFLTSLPTTCFCHPRESTESS